MVEEYRVNNLDTWKNYPSIQPIKTKTPKPPLNMFKQFNIFNQHQTPQKNHKSTVRPSTVSKGTPGNLSVGDHAIYQGQRYYIQFF